MTTTQTTDSALATSILDHVRRYRLMVIESLARLPQTANVPRRELKLILRRLCQEGRLGRAPLYHNRPYYYLAASDADTAQAGPLSEPAKVRSYAMLAFCCLGNKWRTKLTGSDLERLYPALHQPGRPLSYYVALDGQRRTLGYLRVDCGGRGRWDRVLAKCRNDIERHRLNPRVRALIDQGLFEITLVTALPQKAERLQQAMAAWTGTPMRFVCLCALPELLNLIAPPTL